MHVRAHAGTVHERALRTHATHVRTGTNARIRTRTATIGQFASDGGCVTCFMCVTTATYEDALAYPSSDTYEQSDGQTEARILSCLSSSKLQRKDA